MNINGPLCYHTAPSKQLEPLENRPVILKDLKKFLSISLTSDKTKTPFDENCPLSTEFNQSG